MYHLDKFVVGTDFHSKCWLTNFYPCLVFIWRKSVPGCSYLPLSAWLLHFQSEVSHFHWNVETQIKQERKMEEIKYGHKHLWFCHSKQRISSLRRLNVLWRESRWTPNNAAADCLLTNRNSASLHVCLPSSLYAVKDNAYVIFYFLFLVIYLGEKLSSVSQFLSEQYLKKQERHVLISQV